MQKQIVLINDLSGLGRCSLSVWLPILSVLGLECLLLPTALLSNHTAYPSALQKDLSEDMIPWAKQWKALGIVPDALFSGYLASPKQAEHILQIHALWPDVPLFVDPAMADDGQLYSGLSEDIVGAMESLCAKAALITPNLDEAFLLCHQPIESHPSLQTIESLGRHLLAQGADSVVITGLEEGETIANAVFLPGRSMILQETPKAAARRPGTGDVFSAVMVGQSLCGKTLEDACANAAEFVRICLMEALYENTPLLEGVPFEQKLGWLLQTPEPAEREDV